MAYPILQWIQKKNSHFVKMDGQTLVELIDGRYLRFTSRAGDEKWIGNGVMPVDMGWGFHDSRLADYKPGILKYENHPEERFFLLNMQGGKHVMECRNDIILKGVWYEEEECFHYFLTMEFESDLEELYQNSTRCINGYAADPKAPTDIEILDYLPQHISLMDIIHADSYPFPRPLYPWFVMSEDGQEWIKSPKVHIPDMRPRQEGEVSLTLYPGRYGKEGSSFGFADGEYGGWVVRVIETPVPICRGICWMFFDIHVGAPGAIPPRGSCERVSLRYQSEFIPVTAGRCREIIEGAKEYDWRSGDVYDVPVFSYDNRFNDSLRTLPGDKVGQVHFWYQNDECCRMDHTIGYDDSHSLVIERSEATPLPSAWYCRNWGVPYDCIQIRGRRYRVSAMVKTENCTGRARMGKASMIWGGDIFYGVNTHYSDGTPKPRGGTFGGMDIELDLYWAFSDSLTGTNDWTQLSFEFDALDGVINIFLELSGTGKCWFDNVKLEDIGPAERTDFRYTPPEKEIRFLEKWKDFDPWQ